MLILSACGCRRGDGWQGDQSGGSGSPESVTESFFATSTSPQDPQRSDDKKRGEWVERLASYFARTTRRPADRLRSALDSFVAGLGKLEPNENLTLELKIKEFERSRRPRPRDHTADRRRIYVLITRTPYRRPELLDTYARQNHRQ